MQKISRIFQIGLLSLLFFMVTIQGTYAVNFIGNLNLGPLSISNSGGGLGFNINLGKYSSHSSESSQLGVSGSRGMLPGSNAEYHQWIRGNKLIAYSNTGLDGVRKAAKNRSFIQITNYLIGSVAIFWLAFLGFRAVRNNGDEDQISLVKKQFGWIIAGLFFIASSQIVVFGIFDVYERNVLGIEGIFNLYGLMRTLTYFVEFFVAAVCLFIIFRSGSNFIFSMGEQEAVDHQKNMVKSGVFGLGMILLAETFVRVFFPVDLAGNAVLSSGRVVVEIAGIINYVLMFVGIIALGMLTLGCYYWVASFGNEVQVGKAKQIIISSIFGLIIAFSSYTIIAFFVN